MAASSRPFFSPRVRDLAATSSASAFRSASLMPSAVAFSLVCAVVASVMCLVYSVLTRMRSSPMNFSRSETNPRILVNEPERPARWGGEEGGRKRE